MRTSPHTVAVLGTTGFVGSHVVRALEERGAVVRAVKAPRLSTAARDRTSLLAHLESSQVAREVAVLKHAFQGCDAVINAAGVAQAIGEGDELFGANGLLPGVVAAACDIGVRFVHVSSAAVQGRVTMLTEDELKKPFSPYSRAKALGEELAGVRSVCFRPTSVHGAQRRVTQGLINLCSSPLASVAGTGENPTPQVLVQNVGDAAAFLAVTDERPPRFVLQPWEGLTAAGLVRVLGEREPHQVPMPLAKSVISLAGCAGLVSERLSGVARRVEMLWTGQRQQAGWLEGRWRASAGPDEWKALRS